MLVAANIGKARFYFFFGSALLNSFSAFICSSWIAVEGLIPYEI